MPVPDSTGWYEEAARTWPTKMLVAVSDGQAALLLQAAYDATGVQLERAPCDRDAAAHEILIGEPGRPWSQGVWAPELHKIDGTWYIYLAADDGDNEHHRMYVLRGTSANPTDRFELVGKLGDSTDEWAIDGTVIAYGGELYFCWSGWDGRTLSLGKPASLSEIIPCPYLIPAVSGRIR